MQIDAVITWVDSSDENWRNKINQYLENKIDWNNKKESTRYNSINEVEICIQSILKFATYIKNIYLVTDKQKPKNFEVLKNNALKKDVKLELIDHKIIFKKYEKYLPTFNSQSIESVLYKIPNLSEHFVYFNDDMFLINKTKSEDFFKKGFPVLRGKWIRYNEDIFYKKIFITDKKKNKVSHRKAKETASKILGFDKNYNFHHTPYPLRKSTFEVFFKENEEILIQNIRHRFRHLNQYVPQGLINHIEIKNNTWVGEKKLSLSYVQSYNFFKLKKKLFKANMMGDDLLFMCFQSLETANEKSLRFILKWIDKKLDTNFTDEF